MILSFVRWVYGIVLIAMIPTVPLLYAHYRHENVRNLRVVKDGILYRSGQMSEDGLKEVIRDHRIRTVVTFRAARVAGEPHPDDWEEKFCNKQQIHYFRLPSTSFELVDGKAEADVNFRRFCEIMNEPKYYPVLVHCFAGHHRTGQYTAIYRMEFDGWSNERAVREMVANGYDLYEIHQDVREYLANYQPSGNYFADNIE